MSVEKRLYITVNRLGEFEVKDGEKFICGPWDRVRTVSPQEALRMLKEVVDYLKLNPDFYEERRAEVVTVAAGLARFLLGNAPPHDRRICVKLAEPFFETEAVTKLKVR